MDIDTSKAIFTTCEVATICRVAPRTVYKWFDSGRLRGYRIPGSQDRRFPRKYLIKFLREHGMADALAELEVTAEVAAIDPADEPASTDQPEAPISPASLSFEAVNNWVHGGPQYEHLQDCCLTLAVALEQASEQPPEPTDAEIAAVMKDWLDGGGCARYYGQTVRSVRELVDVWRENGGDA